MKDNFLNLPIQTQVAFSTIPIYVSSTQNPNDENEKQIFERQNKFLKLAKNIRWKLASFETGTKIQTIGQKFQFELLRLANITRLIRKYYFGEIRFEDFPREIEQRMGVNLLTAQEITRYLKQEIIDWDPWAEYIASLPKMTVREIVEKHPKLAEEEITSGYIGLDNSDDLENPSLKNWMKDYISQLGYARHSQMQRTEYLFHSENGKSLSSQDREKLAIILKSFDENISLPVDEENREIVFSDQETPGKESQVSGMISSQKPANIPAPPIAQGGQESFVRPYPTANLATVGHSVFTHPQTQAQQGPPVSQGGQPLAPSPRIQQKSNPEIDKYFHAAESPEIPTIKIHSITEQNNPPARNSAPNPAGRIAPAIPLRPSLQKPTQPPQTPHPQHRIYNPFVTPTSEPRIKGNIVDLSEQ